MKRKDLHNSLSFLISSKRDLTEQIASYGINAPLHLLNAVADVDNQILTLKQIIDHLTEHEHDFLKKVYASQELKPASRLYVSLEGIIANTEQTEEINHILKNWRGKAEPEFVTLRTEGTKNRRLVRSPVGNILEAILVYKRIALLGPPGSGKTTCLERLAWQLAERNLKGDQTRLPILIRLSEATTFDTLLDLICSTLERKWGAHVLAEHIDWYLENGSLALLFDGLNEIDPSRRAKLAQDIRLLIDKSPNNIVVISSRILDYDQDLGLQRIEILPLNRTKVREFLELYLGKRRGGHLYGILNNQGFLSLSQNPYYLSAIAFIYTFSKKIPKSRGLLIKTLVELLYKRRQSRKFAEIELPSNILDAFIRWLALISFKNFGGGAPINYHWLSHQAPSTIVEKGVSWPVELQTAIKSAADINILDIQSDWTSINFSHQIIQDYFAGVELILQSKGSASMPRYWSVAYNKKHPTTRRSSGWRDTLPPLPATGWEEPTILAAGCEKYADKLLIAIIKQNPILAARCIVEGNAKVRPKTKQIVINSLVEVIDNEDTSLTARISSGDLLGSIDNAIPDIDEMLLIKGGDFIMGDDKSDAFGNPTPKHIVSVTSFWASKYPVTYNAYEKFVLDNGYKKEDLWSFKGWKWVKSLNRTQPDFWDDPAYHRPNCPVIGVSWYEANAFCRWKGMRLPTEAEWEMIASWDPVRKKKYLYPWGNRFDASAANINAGTEIAGRTTPVGIYEKGKSAYGIFDLVGNVWEWCSSLYMPYPYEAGDGREDSDNDGNRVLRGGTFWSTKEFATTTTRFRQYPGYRFDVAGFRLVSDAAK